MGGAGAVEVSLDGHHLSSLEVKGVPRLYTLFSGESLVTGDLDINFAPGYKPTTSHSADQSCGETPGALD